MQRILRILLVVGLLTPAFSFSVAVAAQDTSSNSQAGSATTTTTTTETEDPAPTNSLADRLSQHKSEFKINLTKAQQTLLKAKCKAAQGVLSSLSGRIKGIQTSRAEVYKNITDKLASLQVKLQNNDIDTTDLQAEIAALQVKVNTYKTDLTAYKQAVADLAAMDCASDPTAFKSTLEAARAAHDKVAKDVADIRSYVNDTIKPTLLKLRQQLGTSGQQSQQ